MNRTEKLKKFDPDENGIRDFGIFGLPFTVDEAQIVLFPVPWEATVSYGHGTSKGPEAILKASLQIDLHDPMFPGGWKTGIAMEEIASHFQDFNESCRAQTELYLSEYGSTDTPSPQSIQILEDVNKLTQQLTDYVKEKTTALLDRGKFVGIVGGEHSVPLGFMQALADKYAFGILQIDAHADLRNAYEGFTHSHASIMYNAAQIDRITKIIQVGVRDFSEGEFEFAGQSGDRIIMYTDHGIKKSLFNMVSWNDLCEHIISQLPENVYISFDIDGLLPWLCPNTGTPVPGGLTIEEAFYLLEKLALSGKKIIGFDLCEVAPGADEWDGNVGSRVLYKLCMLAAKNNKMHAG